MVSWRLLWEVPVLPAPSEEPWGATRCSSWCLATVFCQPEGDAEIMPLEVG